MAQTYHVGDSGRQILLTAIIAAADPAHPNLAASIATLYDFSVNPPPTGQTVAQSGDASGNIIDNQIGAGPVVEGKTLSVVTEVGIVGADQDDRQNSYNGITAKYTLDQGNDGKKDYGDGTFFKSNNPDYTRATLTFNVKFT